MADRLNIEFDDNGDIKVTTDEISPANHRTADNILEFIAQQTGGEVTRTKRPQAQHHTHHVVKQGGK